jgi:hypothetical protein
MKSKKVYYFLIAVSMLLQSISLLHAQNTSGKEFWLTCGKVLSLNINNISMVDMQIRVVAGNLPTSVTLYFTYLDAS